VYRDLGPRRPLRAAAEAFDSRASGTRERPVDKWSRTFRWVERGDAWDEACVKCLVRWCGTDPDMVERVQKNAAAIGAGRGFQRSHLVAGPVDGGPEAQRL
jgi:hypothetical protein